MSVPGVAALYLLQNGVTGAELARKLGVTRQAVSLQLAGGTASTSPELLEAIEELAGEEAARVVGLIVERERKART